MAYINQRLSCLSEEPYSYFTVFDPKEMPQDQADLATSGNKEVRFLVDYFHHFSVPVNFFWQGVVIFQGGHTK